MESITDTESVCLTASGASRGLEKIAAIDSGGGDDEGERRIFSRQRQRSGGGGNGAVAVGGGGGLSRFERRAATAVASACVFAVVRGNCSSPSRCSTHESLNQSLFYLV